ncbi:Amidase [Gemmatirosa kalamazoonensis]|uniref:Amidase n=1 Tax=Gemmatirosa kalamazoonensis TaxID=861299 RepID=W0RF26_9BACT|nr:amidase [Gemmatirosa kalamazoonensis]AHG89047.1 Amidase [Gemmatirosa kalamazoonensis]
MDRRAFVAAVAISGLGTRDSGLAPPESRVPSPESRVPGPELEEATLDDLQGMMASGRHTSRSITQLYLDRIATLDRADGDRPGVNSVIELNPDALQIADAMDAERKAGRVRGPLHGVPVLVKDNIDTADRMETTAGSLALVGAAKPKDAFVAERLRAAGAVLLGKTNLSEWANFRSTHSVSGWSGRGGQTRNPYALDRNPCGSSSGSGAAASASFCAVAVGTETDGSVVCPSSTNGLVGIKPTLGLVSRAGIVPIAHSQDTAGPMTRTVRDAAILLGVLAGADPRDPLTASSRGHAERDYTRHLDANGLKGARIGVSRKSMGFSRDVDRLVEDALDVMKRAGATIVDPANLPTDGQFDAAEGEVLRYEFKADLNAYLAARGVRLDGAPATLQSLIDWNARHADREMPYFGQELFEQSQAKGPLTTPAYRSALAKSKRLAGTEGIDAALRAHRLDALVAPTGQPAWTIDLLNGDHFTGGYSSASAVAGYAHVTVPAGMVHGLPVGLSFFAGAWSEPTLLRLAYAFEQATKHRRAPRFLASANLAE